MSSNKKRSRDEPIGPQPGDKFDAVDEVCVNTLRCLGAELPNIANSGHPGAPMGMAPMAHVLFSRHLKASPNDPFWLNRDRFVLSNGHACALLYSLLHLLGYADFKSTESLRQFRQVGSKTPGHPESSIGGKRVGGVEVTTGPLGQGIANAVGMASAALHLYAQLRAKGGDDAVIDSRVFVFVGDGCLQEGVSGEAASLAGHLGLHNLVVLYDDNDITIDGPTNLSFSEDVGARFEAYGWRVLSVANGDTDLAAIDAALTEATSGGQKPTLIKVKTTIGLHATTQGTQKVHGSPIGPEDLARVKRELGLDPAKQLEVPAAVRQRYETVARRGDQAAVQWHAGAEASLLARQTDDASRTALRRRLAGELPPTSGWQAALDDCAGQLRQKLLEAGGGGQATRKTSAAVLDALTRALPGLVGGSADLTPSTLTLSDAAGGDFQKDSRAGRYFRFGVREHGMAAFCNGLFAFQPGVLIPFCATFFNFVQYLLPALRLSALSHFGVIYVMTHDSIGLGEDGPTHQPVGALATCRSIPNTLVLRPADATETAGAYRLAIAARDRPSVLCLTRQTVPELAGSKVDAVAHGAYVVDDEGNSAAALPQLVLVGTGSEVHLCVAAARLLRGSGPTAVRTRVVSMPCWSLFDQQTPAYRQSVFPANVPVLAVEAGSSLGWSRYSHASVSLDRFGLSGPAKDVFAALGFTPESVETKGRALLDHYKGKHVPDLMDRFQ